MFQWVLIRLIDGLSYARELSLHSDAHRLYMRGVRLMTR